MLFVSHNHSYRIRTPPTYDRPREELKYAKAGYQSLNEYDCNAFGPIRTTSFRALGKNEIENFIQFSFDKNFPKIPNQHHYLSVLIRITWTPLDHIFYIYIHDLIPCFDRLISEQQHVTGSDSWTIISSNILFELS